MMGLLCCNKDNLNDFKDLQNTQRTVDEICFFDFSSYIDSISHATGININSIPYNVVSCESLSRLTRQLESATQITFRNTETHILDTLLFFAEQMNYYIELNDDINALAYYDSIIKYCSRHYNFIFVDNLTDTVIHNQAHSLPFTQIQSTVSDITHLHSYMCRTSTNYDLLDEREQSVVLSAILCKHIFNNETRAQFSDCRSRAKALFALALTAATVKFTAKAAACAGTNIAVLLCEGYAAASYAIEIATAKELYDYRLAECASLNN